jgi:threonine dehydrogenase-like Zn-dependent dehydrogenase
VPSAGQLISIEAFQIFRNGLNILSSFTSLRNSHQALDLLERGRVQAEDLISHRQPFEGFQHGIELIEKGNEPVYKVMILPNG